MSRLSPIRPIQPCPQIKEIAVAARAFGLRLQSRRFEGLATSKMPFSHVQRECRRFYWVADASLSVLQERIAELAVKNRLPAMYGNSEPVDAGGLMSYGAGFVDFCRRAATYVDKILKGTKPADLPVEQPTKFEFVINLKAAKQIGLTIPPNVLARANKVIK